MCAVHTAQVTGNQLTEAEVDFLAANEPLVDLVLTEVEGISQGRQSRVSVLTYPRDDELQYVIWKRMGVGKRLTRPEAAEMWVRLAHYKQSLESGGWAIPALLYSTVVDVSDVESQISRMNSSSLVATGIRCYLTRANRTFASGILSAKSFECSTRTLQRRSAEWDLGAVV